VEKLSKVGQKIGLKLIENWSNVNLTERGRIHNRKTGVFPFLFFYSKISIKNCAKIWQTKKVSLSHLPAHFNIFSNSVSCLKIYLYNKKVIGQLSVSPNQGI